MFCGFILAPLGLATGAAYANVNFFEYLIRLGIPMGIAISILYWLKSLKLLRPTECEDYQLGSDALSASTLAV
jgi:hypothetical protein